MGKAFGQRGEVVDSIFPECGLKGGVPVWAVPRGGLKHLLRRPGRPKHLKMKEACSTSPEHWKGFRNRQSG
ncbi:MAG: hypothetical protein IPN22_09870 [Bacteroidetes bacterium]|nr:hypothetical protein [Bacteroidota bacterium]